MGCVETAAGETPGPFGRRAARRRTILGWGLVVLSLTALGCGTEAPPEGAQRPSEIVDVKPMIADVEISGDQQAVARKPSLIGVLPSDFPDDVPMYLPASLVDFGNTADGGRSVSLATATGRSQVSDQLAGLLVAQGWQSEGDSGGRTVWRKGERTVRLRIETASTGTVYHFEY